MRRAIGIMALVPVLAMVSACGGASKVKSEIASIAEPREALAAAAEAMAKEAFYVEYELDFDDEEIDGTFVIARRGENNVFLSETEYGDFSWYDLGGTQYICTSGADGIFSIFGTDRACYEIPVEDEDDDSFGEFEGMLFDTVSMVSEMVDDEDVQIEDAPDKKVAGVEGRCFKITADDDEGGVLCVAKDSGILLLIDGLFDGDDGKMELKKHREPKDSDFELPYEVEEITTGLVQDNSFIPEPKQDKEASIPSQRIAGPPFAWETEPALCPDLELPGFGGLAALGDGRFIVGDYEDSIIVSPDCKTQPVEIDSFEIAGIGDGRIYYAKSAFDGPVIIRRNADGTETVVAGAECKQSSCKTGGEGRATEVVLDWVQDIAPAADGSFWFFEAITDAKKNDPLYRLRHVTAQGELKTVETGKKIDFAQLVSGPNGGVYVLQFGNDSFLLDSVGKVAKDKLKLDSSCAAAGRDGDLWTYDILDNDLQVRKADGSTKTFHFAPEKSFFCQQMAVQANGDLLIESFGVDDEAGLWLVPNPLK